MSEDKRFRLREWIVPPIVLPLFLGLLILASVLLQA